LVSKDRNCSAPLPRQADLLRTCGQRPSLRPSAQVDKLAAPQRKMPHRIQCSAWVCAAAALIMSLPSGRGDPLPELGVGHRNLSLLLPGGDDVYPSCTKEQVGDSAVVVAPCALCLWNGTYGALNPEVCSPCCGDIVTGSGNQMVVCNTRNSGCCYRLLMDGAAGPSVTVAEDFAATARDSASTSCVWSKSDKCKRCAFGKNGNAPVSCPDGLAIPVRVGASAGR
jgi:hypothetical protein